MGPLESWKALVDSGEFQHDPAQAKAIEALEEVYQRLMMRWADPAPVTRWRRLLGRRAKPESVKGLYMWGGVGRGKTWMMDLFFSSVPGDRKLRMHFHRFMKRVHADLKRLEDKTDPLVYVADEIASEADVICFDEFFVTDITDAMILGRLFELLFARGITLVATSNIVPERLYENGLQRRRFLPAIEALMENCEVLNIDSDTDYRLRTLTQAKLYYDSNSAETQSALKDSFSQLSMDHSPGRANVSLEISGRSIQAKRVNEDVVWFTFDALCNGPRSQHDYIELAKEFHAVIVSEVPQLTSDIEDQARRFVYMVDEFYDSGVKLILSADVPLLELYRGERLTFEFQRTTSRLLEMQSEDYLAREHRA